MARKPTTPEESKPERLMLAYLCIKDAPNLQEQIAILDRFGLSDQEIAQVTVKKSRAISDARYELSRKKKPN